ncbi:MAG: hypothetical protein ABSD47_07300 [Candidatus Methylomirabilota bacterium]|jgi:hypothetical protein
MYEDWQRALPELGDDIYLRAVATEILTALRSEPLTFPDLLTTLRCCDPLVVGSVLGELRVSGSIGEDASSGAFRLRDVTSMARARPRARHPGAEISVTTDALSLIREIKACLPPASPAYYQWWFEDFCYPTLAQRVLRLARARSKLMFIGAPSLGAYVSRRTTAQTWLVDVDEALLRALAPTLPRHAVTSVYDVFDGLEPDLRGGFELVYTDPPWYPEFINQFLARAVEACAPRGYIFISLPPPYTRPGVEQERQSFLSLARSFGLKLLRRWPSGTRYEVPPFERQAYLRCGLTLDRPWRSGDLLLFRRPADPMRYAPAGDSVHAPRWVEFRFGSTRVFLSRDERTRGGEPSLSAPPGHPDFTLGTTSRRELGRGAVNLITSRNRAAVATGTRELASVLVSLARSGDLRGDQDQVRRSGAGFRTSALPLLDALAALLRERP